LQNSRREKSQKEFEGFKSANGRERGGKSIKELYSFEKEGYKIRVALGKRHRSK